MASACDCLILGGGAAGASLACLLAQRGQRVVLVDRGRAHLSGPYETLLAPARTLLARTGLAAAIEAGAEIDPLRHGAIWGTDEVEWRRDDAAGLLLRRGEFDRCLRAAAAAAGATVLCPATAVATGGAFELQTATGALRMTAQHVVRATGRAPQAAAPAAPTSAARQTLAFTFVGTPGAADRGTAVVEAVRSGWIWTHAPLAGSAAAAVIVDADELRMAGRAQLLARVFAESRGPAGRLTARRLAQANDATPRLAAATAGMLVIGDAAATIDPLASQGVEKALAAADHAAAILATAARHPAWWERLCALHGRWERGLFDAHREVAAAWYRREERFADAPFWQRRRASIAAVEPAGDEPLVVAATIEPAAVLVRQGAEFVERPGFVDRRSGDESTHIGYVPIEPLLAMFERPRRLAEAVVEAGRAPRLFVLPPRAVHGALLQLRRRGWLTAATNAAGTR